MTIELSPKRQSEVSRICNALDSVFGREWLALTYADKQLIVRDCMEDGGVSDFRQYRRNIGTGNLESYAKVMRVRFSESAK